MRRTLVIAVVVAAVLCATAAWSQGPPGPGGPGMGMGRGPMMACPVMATQPPPPMMLDRMTQALQLSADQMTQIRDIIGKAQPTMQPLAKAAGDATKALRTALLAPTLDAAAVKDLAAKAEKAEADVVTANIGIWSQIRGVLTADQAAKLADALMPPPPPQGGPGGPGAPPPPPAE